MQKSLLAGIAAGFFLISLGISAQSSLRNRLAHRDPPRSVAIFVYPEELTSRDRLTDGDTERLLRLDDNTLLLWIDLEPGLFFTHPTAYVLISAEGVRVERGNWWPVLNGQAILYGKRNRIPVISPFQVRSSNGFVEVYFYPEELSPRDRVSDGGEGTEVPLESSTFLAWVDLQPELRFTHPTAYLLIGADRSVRILEGGWWPELNGRTVLYGSRNKYGINFPFRLVDPPR